MVECLVWDQDVAGSSPVVPTLYFINMLDIFYFDCVIYPVIVVITIGNELSSLDKTFTDCDGNSLGFSDLEFENSKALTYTAKRKEDNNFCIIISFEDKDSFTYKTVAHEAVHAAKEIFSFINADINPHEPFEYLVGYIAQCCDNSLKNI